MNREEREKFVRRQIVITGAWESVVQAIVNRWEDDIEENRMNAASYAAFCERESEIS